MTCIWSISKQRNIIVFDQHDRSTSTTMDIVKLLVQSTIKSKGIQFSYDF